ncbi:MAG: DUF418 domain-containing protein [Candidatus Binatia bacterium]
MKPSLAPISPSERIQSMDILRGFAVFGILCVNMASFRSPAFIPGYVPPPGTPLDQAVAFLIKFLAEGKFYSLFSFLFGIGFYVQMSRAEAKGRNMLSFYPRRLLVLLLFGVLHALLLWDGEILRLYAVLGFALLLFRNRPLRTLVVTSAVFFLISAVLLALPFERWAISYSGIDFVAQARAVYTGNSYSVVLVHRVRQFPDSVLYLFYEQGPSVFALFLLGLWAGRQRIFENIEAHRSLLRRVFWIGLVIGLVGNLAFATSHHLLLSSVAVTVGAPALSFCYASGLSLLAQLPRWHARLAPLAKVGRMALSNYILQSIVCTVLFYGYGFGLYERVGAFGGLLLTFAIYLIQIPLSAWWLRRFNFGPLEWLWRLATYGQWPSLRHSARQPGPAGPDS